MPSLDFRVGYFSKFFHFTSSSRIFAITPYFANAKALHVKGGEDSLWDRNLFIKLSLQVGMNGSQAGPRTLRPGLPQSEYFGSKR